MTELADRIRPITGASACFDTDKAGVDFTKELEHLRSTQNSPEDNMPALSDGVDLKD